MKGVRTEHPEYTATASQRTRCNDVVAGQDAVYAGGSSYLPRLHDQATDDYTAMQQRGTFFNATARTLAGWHGMLFRKPPEIDIDASIKAFESDIDLSGGSLADLIKNISREHIVSGRAGLMVDYPRLPDDVVGQITLSVAEASNVRPYIKSYKAADIINWRYGTRNNKSSLELVVLVESSPINKDDFGHELKPRYRVLDLLTGVYRQRVFEIGDRGEDVLVYEFTPLLNGRQMDFIPFKMSGDGVPLLLDLADMNLSHFRSTVIYEHGCHFTGLPQAYISGYRKDDGETLYIGGASAWIFPEQGTAAAYLEFSGQGLSALKENIELKQRQMVTLGLRMLGEDKKAAETATTALISRAGENSILASIANDVSALVSSILNMMSLWKGSTGQNTVKINRDFIPETMAPDELNALVAAWQSGAISSQVKFDRLKAGEIIPQETTFDEEEARLMDAAPSVALR